MQVAQARLANLILALCAVVLFAERLSRVAFAESNSVQAETSKQTKNIQVWRVQDGIGPGLHPHAHCRFVFFDV
jgi:hypothetical protein